MKNTINHELCKNSDNFIELPENKINFKEYINFISNRRSIRNFKENKIGKTLPFIEKFLDDL